MQPSRLQKLVIEKICLETGMFCFVACTRFILTCELIFDSHLIVYFYGCAKYQTTGSDPILSQLGICAYILILPMFYVLSLFAKTSCSFAPLQIVVYVAYFPASELVPNINQNNCSSSPSGELYIKVIKSQLSRLKFSLIIGFRFLPS